MCVGWKYILSSLSFSCFTFTYSILKELHKSCIQEITQLPYSCKNIIINFLLYHNIMQFEGASWTVWGLSFLPILGEGSPAEEKPRIQLGSDLFLHQNLTLLLLCKTGSSTALWRPVSYNWCTAVGDDCCNKDHLKFPSAFWRLFCHAAMNSHAQYMRLVTKPPDWLLPFHPLGRLFPDKSAAVSREFRHSRRDDARWR